MVNGSLTEQYMYVYSEDISSQIKVVVFITDGTPILELAQKGHVSMV